MHVSVTLEVIMIKQNCQNACTLNSFFISPP